MLVNGRRPSEDLWHRTLSQIPAVYGRLVYLASLRNSDSGRYLHHGLAMVFGEDEADRALRESHLGAFREWLGMNLEQQKADLVLYLTGQPIDRRTMVENWIRLAPYRGVLPTVCSEAERGLFLLDLETLLELLKNARGAA